MSKFDIPIASAKNRSMNVSLPEQMEQFVRQKVAVGDYETASEVVREGLRLLKLPPLLPSWGPRTGPSQPLIAAAILFPLPP